MIYRYAVHQLSFILDTNVACGKNIEYRKTKKIYIPLNKLTFFEIAYTRQNQKQIKYSPTPSKLCKVIKQKNRTKAKFNLERQAYSFK